MQNFIYGEEQTLDLEDKVLKIYIKEKVSFYAETRKFNTVEIPQEGADTSLKLSFNSQTKLYEARILRYWYKEVFKDTGNIKLGVKLVTMAYSTKNQKLFCSKTETFNLYKDNSTGKVSAFLNGRFVYLSYLISKVLNNIYVYLRDDLKDILNVSCERPSYLSYYRVTRNLRLKDLPWDTKTLTSLYYCDSEYIAKQRAKVLRALRSNNTAKAIDLCYFGFKYPKSIRKFIINNYEPLKNEEACKAIFELTQSVETNRVLEILKLDKNLKYSYLFIRNLGFSHKHIINTAKKDTMILRDVRHIRRQIVRLNITENTNPFKGETISDYHDRIDILYALNKSEKQVKQNKIMESYDTSKNLPSYTKGNLTIRSAFNPVELIVIGTKMNICVGSYAKQVFTKQLDIAVVTDKSNNYLACIEVVSGYIVQAKLKRNRMVTEDDEITTLIQEWASLNSLTIYTKDLGIDTPSYIARPEPCKEQLSLLGESTSIVENNVDYNHYQNIFEF